MRRKRTIKASVHRRRARTVAMVPALIERLDAMEFRLKNAETLLDNHGRELLKYMNIGVDMTPRMFGKRTFDFP